MAHNDTTESTGFHTSVDSFLNEAVLMSSTDTFSETITNNNDQRLSKTRNKRSVSTLMTGDSKKLRTASNTFENGTNFPKAFDEISCNDIGRSKLWGALTMLQKSFIDSNVNNEKKNDDEIIDSLHEMYDCDPENFTSHLVTIIEETSDLSISGTLQDFSFDSPISCKSDHSSDSTRYMNLEGFRESKNGKNPRKTCLKDVTISINGKIADSKSDSDCRTPRLRNVTYDKIPRVLVTPGTPLIHDRNNVESLENFNDDESYLTAESEFETSDDDKTIEETTNDEINMSKVARHHKEWLKTYKKVFCQYKPKKNTFATPKAKGRGKIVNHSIKSEKLWLHELTNKREKCFDTINHLVENAVAKTQKQQEINEKSQSSSIDCCQRQMCFYNTLMACLEYTCAINDKRDSLSCSGQKTSVKTNNRRSVSRTPAKLMTQDPSNSRESRENSGKKITRKSLGKKNKSPSVVTSYKSPRRKSIVKSPVRKSLTNTRKNSNREEIDQSSIRPVSQLRMIFSPRNKLPASSEAVRPKIMSSKIVPPKIYISKFSITPSTSEKRISPTNKKQFKHVKSPVREYIRGTATLKTGDNRLEGN